MPDIQAVAPVDLAEGLQRAGNDRAFYKELLEMLVADLPRQAAEMRTALERGDLEALRRTAHAVKGAAASLAAGTARELAFQIETFARSGRPDGIAPLITDLEQEGERLRAFAGEL
ncbi:MAG: Hpt domain-containing protein [Acidobacteria bacterium]|nr:MAG: Hpt domain-containing protein [Acidobacteriota bacterium]